MRDKVWAAVQELDRTMLKCEEISALAFVIWDSYDNGGFRDNDGDYSPVLLLLTREAGDFKREMTEAMGKLLAVLKEGEEE